MQLEAQLEDRNVTIELTEAARDWLVRKGYDPIYGARPLARVIQEHIKTPLADELLFGKIAKGGLVSVTVEDDKLSFEYVEAPPKAKRKKKDPGEGGDEEVTELVE